MDEKPEPVEQHTEKEQADSGWVLPPDVPSGTSIELATLTKVNSSTPEVLELLQRLMVSVQESEAAKAIEGGCDFFAGCGTYSADSCRKLTSCDTFKRVM